MTYNAPFQVLTPETLAPLKTYAANAQVSQLTTSNGPAGLTGLSASPLTTLATHVGP
jgi:hypothetical protein